MDEFLRGIHTALFKEWILNKKIKGCKIKENNNKIILTTPYCHGEVIFNPHDLIELSVTNLINDKIEFYLHFQMNTMSHAISLYSQMMECIVRLVNKPPIRILLTCTSGLTTGFFASQLDEASTLLSKNYKFDAVAYNELFEAAKNYEVILIAPQVSYQKAKIESCFKNKTVLAIPSAIFAKYDAGAMLEFLEEHLTLKKHATTARLPIISQPVAHNSKILTIATVRTSHRSRIIYRVFSTNNSTLLDNEVVKFDFQISDLYDVLDTVLLFHPDIPIIGISLPGIVRNGIVDINGKRTNVLELLNNRYPEHRFHLFNDVNALVSGYYISQNKYKSISFLFRPSIGSAGGIGSIFKGQLIEGAHHIAGEMKYLPLNYSSEKEELKKSLEGNLEILTLQAVAIISIFDPEILLVSYKYSNKEQLSSSLQQYLPKDCLPRIHFVEHFKEYALFGSLILSIQEEENNKEL